MKASPDKCHRLLRTDEEANIQILNRTIKCSKSKTKKMRIFIRKWPGKLEHLQD